jgi:Tfp pilus assembly protein PilX
VSQLRERVARLSAREEGWVVVTAIVLMVIMLGVGLAVLATADTQSQQSRRERARESSFNLAEGLMQAESVVLQTNWPTQAPCAGNTSGCGYTWSTAAPDTCTQATAAGNPLQCPNPSSLVGSSGAFSNVDQSLAGTTWKVQVRDDPGVCLPNPPAGYVAFYNGCQIPTYYRGLCPPPNELDATKCWPATSPHTYSTNPTEAPGVDQKNCTDASNNPVVCTWDANGNNQLWVRVDATVNGRTRSMVALLHLEDFPVSINSKDAVNAGAVNFGNSGNKHIVDATNSQIVTRCIPSDNYGGSPSTGNQLKTTLLADVGANVNTITIPASATGFSTLSSGDVLALGADSMAQPPYELLVIQSNTVAGATRTITFTRTTQYAHTASAGSNKVELAPAPVANNPNRGNNCESWISPPARGQNGADKSQLDSPWNYRSDPTYPNFLDDGSYAAVVSGLKAWTTCPTSWGGNIYIKTLPAGTQCQLPAGTINSAAAPHFIFVEDQTGGCGTQPELVLRSNTVYYGVIYFRNKQNCGFDQTILQLTAGAQLQGGIAVDGWARVEIGNASNTSNCAVQGGGGAYCPTVKFDPVPFGQVAATGAAGLVQNTWRELAPGQ